MLKTPERIQDEKDTLALLVLLGFVFPPLWIAALFYVLGGGGRPGPM